MQISPTKKNIGSKSLRAFNSQVIHFTLIFFSIKFKIYYIISSSASTKPLQDKYLLTRNYTVTEKKITFLCCLNAPRTDSYAPATKHMWIGRGLVVHSQPKERDSKQSATGRIDLDQSLSCKLQITKKKIQFCLDQFPDTEFSHCNQYFQIS